MFEKGHAKTGGRKAGVPNKIPAYVTGDAWKAYQKLGGVNWLMLPENWGLLGKMLVKLIPNNIQLSDTDGKEVVFKILGVGDARTTNTPIEGIPGKNLVKAISR